MFNLGFSEILVILVVALIFIGPKRLPEVARTLGRTLAQARNTLEDLKKEFVLPKTRYTFDEVFSPEDGAEHSEPTGEHESQSAEAPAEKPTNKPD